MDESKVDAVVDHLMGDRLFSGWGAHPGDRAGGVQSAQLPRRHGVAA